MGLDSDGECFQVFLLDSAATDLDVVVEDELSAEDVVVGELALVLLQLDPQFLSLLLGAFQGLFYFLQASITATLLRLGLKLAVMLELTPHGLHLESVDFEVVVEVDEPLRVHVYFGVPLRHHNYNPPLIFLNLTPMPNSVPFAAITPQALCDYEL